MQLAWLSTNRAIAGTNSKDRTSKKYGDFKVAHLLQL